MNIISTLFNCICIGDIEPVYMQKKELNEQIIFLLNKNKLTKNEVEYLRQAIIIGTSAYENTDIEMLPIEDGVWDMMVEKYRKYTTEDSYPVGSKPINNPGRSELLNSNTPKRLFSYITEDEEARQENMLFPEIMDYYPITSRDIVKHLFTSTKDRYITKRMHNTTHNHPDLVGTFDKCKFVLVSQAKDKGIADEPSTRIMERDFFQPLLNNGIIDYNTEITMIATLKYDGVSVEGDITDRVESARSRGDTVNGEAIDMTPLLGGYRFPKTPIDFMKDSPVGVKFEAIIDRFNLVKANELKGREYKNCRTAIIGITGSSDGYRYKDLITLIPISTDIKDGDGEPLDRLVEIEFLNSYYTRDQPLRYSVLSGTYTQILFQIKKYVEDAEFARSYLPFMYDGVVFEFYNKDIRTGLGRDNSIDRYKCAIKFEPLTKLTTFREYKYTIGQDGSITPMIYYDPVEFFGTIHPKSSGHSYNRFMELDLHVGDIIEVTYRNDVMPYVSKPDNIYNSNNSVNPHTELDTFPQVCPSCNKPIVLSPTGKSAYCINIECPERSIQRMTATLAKIGVVNFGEETVRTLGYTKLRQFIRASEDDFAVLGVNNKTELRNQLKNIMKIPIYDYKIMGALGFDNIGEKTWKLILNKISIKELIEYFHREELTPKLFADIKGIGPGTISTILEEFEFFIGDIYVIDTHMHVISSVGIVSNGKQIRFTGCRDANLEKELSAYGHDVDGNSGVTQKTDILIVPYYGYNQGSKVTKAKRYGIEMLPMQEFINNLDQYL